MKKSIYIFMTVVIAVLFSCKQNEKKEENQDLYMHHDSTMIHHDSTMMHQDDEMMHNDKEMKEHSSVYVCPMHPHVHGTINDKCPECGMALEAQKK